MLSSKFNGLSKPLSNCDWTTNFYGKENTSVHQYYTVFFIISRHSKTSNVVDLENWCWDFSIFNYYFLICLRACYETQNYVGRKIDTLRPCRFCKFSVSTQFLLLTHRFHYELSKSQKFIHQSLLKADFNACVGRKG